MTSTDALILDLSADLAPVKRRSMARDALFLLALAAVELALVFGMGAMRPDMGMVILSPYMIWKLGSLALLASLSSAIVMRSFTPPASARHGVALMLGIAGLIMVGGIFVTSAPDAGRSLIDRLSPAHGLICTAAIVVLALPMMAMLAVLMRRAAPVQPRDSAIAAGISASTIGALVFAFCCPANDPLYIVVWYSAGVAMVTAIARWLLPRRFRL